MGSGPNCGKSYFAKQLSAQLGTAVILSNDEIRIPIHGNKRPDINHWREATEAERQVWYANFDTHGGSCVDDTGQIMTVEDLTKQGGPWKYSSRETSKYIRSYVSLNPMANIIIEGQFQLTADKEENITLLTDLAKIGAHFIYIETDIKTCQDRHRLSGKTYPVELVEKYARFNLSLKEWLKNPEWRKNLNPEQAAVLGSHNQLVLSSIDDLPKTIGYETIIGIYATAVSGKPAADCLRQDVKDMDVTREEMEKIKASAEQADAKKITEHCWAFESKVRVKLDEGINALYLEKNPLIHGCMNPISDFAGLVEVSCAPPLFITLPSRPSAQVIMDMADHGNTCNGYDIPCLAMINGHVLSAIPDVYAPFKDGIETAFHFFLSVKKRIGDPDDLIILLSSQTCHVPHGKAGSLIGLHYDNIATPADEMMMTDVKTKQYPTILLTYEVEKNPETGEIVYIDSSEQETMGTIIYSSGFIKAAELPNLKAEEFAPLEGAVRMLTYCPDIKVHKSENGRLSIFNHLHKAVVNTSKRKRTRSQWRFMVVQRKNFNTQGNAFLGYDKQSENTVLSKLLQEHGYDPLDSPILSKCSRYQHRDPHHFDRPKTYLNAQTHVQTHGLQAALKLKLVQTRFPRIVVDIFNTPQVEITKETFSSTLNLRSCSS